MRVDGGVDALAELVEDHEAGDLGEGLDVVGGFVGRAGEEDDELDGLAVDGFEVERVGGLADGHGELGHARGLAVGDGEAVADAGGSGHLASPDGIFETGGIADAARGGEDIDEFVDDALFVAGREWAADAIEGEDIGQIHAETLGGGGAG